MAVSIQWLKGLFKTIAVLVAKTPAFILAFCLWAIPVQAEQRIWLPATINGKPARLVFDTGANGIFLFEKGADRLGVPFNRLPPNLPRDPFRVPATPTGECELVLAGTTLRTSFLVTPGPNIGDVIEDGMVGWPPFAQSILTIDADRATVISLPSVPEEAAKWVRFKVHTNFCTLDLEVPDRGGKVSLVRVDTGTSSGVKLSPRAWRDWKAAHKQQHRTLNAYYDSGGRLVVSEETWADEISFGPLVITDVPVMEANKVDILPGPIKYQATLGLMALARLDLIIDGKEGVAYLQPRKTPPSVYGHNCLGAVFAPPDLRNPQAGDLVAHVAAGSPAAEAGIRNGDVLLKVGQTDVTRWYADGTGIPRFWTPANGTKIELTLKRGRKTLTVRPVLRQILPTKTSEPPKADNPKRR